VTRDAEALLLVLVLNGAEMPQADAEAEVRRLGLFEMTDAEFDTWKRRIGPQVRAACALARVLSEGE
jgi:hypothetical protein